LISSTLINKFDMASVGPNNYAVVVRHVGGSKASDIKLVLQRDPRTGKTLFHVGSILPNEEHVDAIIRELFEKTGLAMTVDDLTLFSNKYVPVPLPERKRHFSRGLSTQTSPMRAVTAAPTGAMALPLTQSSRLISPSVAHGPCSYSKQVASPFSPLPC
jgi:8-oxo-dGTP pyrophosphatase MutT (NUDIX family)